MPPKSSREYPIKLRPHLLEDLDIASKLSPDAYATLEAANATIVTRLLAAAEDVSTRTGAKTIDIVQLRTALLRREFDFLSLLYNTRRE